MKKITTIMLALLMMAGFSATAQTRTTVQKAGTQINRIEKVMAQAPRRMTQEDVEKNDTASRILENDYVSEYNQYYLVLYGKYYFDYIFWINDTELKLNHEYTIANGGLDATYCGAAYDYTGEDFFPADAASLYVTQDEHGMYTISAQFVFEDEGDNYIYNVYYKEYYFEEVGIDMLVDEEYASQNVTQVYIETDNYLFVYGLNGLTFDADKEYTLEDMNPEYTALSDGYDFNKVDGAYLKKTIVNGKAHIEGWMAMGPYYYAVIYDEPAATAVDQVENANGVVKSIENGQLIIRREGVRYNAMGVQLR